MILIWFNWLRMRYNPGPSMRNNEPSGSMKDEKCSHQTREQPSQVGLCPTKVDVAAIQLGLRFKNSAFLIQHSVPYLRWYISAALGYHMCCVCLQFLHSHCSTVTCGRGESCGFAGILAWTNRIEFCVDEGAQSFIKSWWTLLTVDHTTEFILSRTTYIFVYFIL